MRARALAGLRLAAIVAVAAGVLAPPACAAGGTISGTVTDAAGGAGIAGADVVAYDRDGDFAGDAGTDGAGHYAVHDLAPGTYRVEFDADGYPARFYDAAKTFDAADDVTVSDGGTTGGIDAALARGGGIAGTVTDAATGTPLRDVEVDLYDGAGFAGYAETDSRGEYDVEGVDAGTYTLALLPSSQSPYGRRRIPGVTVTAGTTGQKDVQLIGQTVITGTVEDASGPLSGATVDVSDRDGTLETEVYTDADGAYAAGGLAPGSYVVEFTSTDTAPEFFDGKATLAASDPVTTAVGSPATADATLAPGGRIAGTVSDAVTHAPLEGVSVVARDGGGDFIAAAQTDAAGGYVLTGLGSGSYGLAFAAHDDRHLELDRDAVGVTAGQTTSGVDAALAVGAAIAGTVTDALSGAPAADVAVEAYDAADELVGDAVTDGSGAYRLGGLEPGTYTVRFRPDPASAWAPQTATPIALAAGQTATADAALTGGGALAGTVTDAAQQPLAGAHVTVSGPDYAATAVTDAAGRYAAGGLPAGDYTVQVSAAGHLSQSAGSFTVTAGAVTRGADAALGAGGTLSGRVTDAQSGAGLAGLEVDVYRGEPAGTATTGADGSYSVAGLPTGDYTVVVTVPADDDHVAGSTLSAHVTAGAATTGVDAALVRGGRISGTVTGAHDVDVMLFDAGGFYVDDVVTDAQGAYLSRPLAPGSYRVEFFAANAPGLFYDGKASFADATPVTVAAGQTTDHIDATLSGGGRISGTVTDPVLDAPVPDIGVQILAADGTYVSGTQTDEGGRYSVRGLPAGSYRVEFQDPSFRGGHGVSYGTQFYDGAATLAGSTPVAVTEGQTTTGIDAALRRAGRIEGRVTDAATGAPVADVWVSAYDDAGQYVTGAATDAAGDYAVTGLPGGSYRVGFSSPFGGAYQAQYYNGRSSLDAADPVTVAAGQTATGIDAALGSGGSISGTVTDAVTHAPLAGIVVSAYSAGDGFGLGVSTDAQGHYTIHGLHAGGYSVSTFAPAGDYVATTHPGTVTVTVGQESAGIDFALARAGTVTGTVSGPGGPAAGVSVAAYDVDGHIVANAATDQTGVYRLGVPGGSFRIGFATLSGSGDSYLPAYWHDRATLAAADPVTVTTGQTLSGIDATLTAGGTIRGRITDADTHAAIGGASAVAYDAGGNYATSAGASPDGTYTLTGLRSGTYKVELSAPGHQAQWYDGRATMDAADPVGVTEGQTTSGVDGALSAGGSIAGTVTDAVTHQPLAGIQVTAFDGAPVAGATTAADGTYRIDGLGAGTYSVAFSAPGGDYQPATVTGITVSGTAVTAGVDAALTPAARISGTVTDADDGHPLAGIHVSASPTTAGGTFAGATTDAAGHYTIGGLAAGTYALDFYADQGDNYAEQFYGGGSSYPGTTVDVADAQAVAGIDAALHPGGRVTGTVTDSATGQPIAGVEVSVGGRSATTAADGGYVVDGLDTGDYTVLLEDPSGYHVQRSLAPLHVTLGQTSAGADAALDPAGRIAGTLTDRETGQPLSDQEVDVYSGDRFVRAAVVDPSGRYAVGELPPGAYRVGFSSSSSNFDPYGPAFADGTQTVTAGVTTSLDAALTPKPTMTAAPAVAGTAKQGETLTLTRGTWAHAPTGYAEQWLRCDGSDCHEIPGATGAGYVLTFADAGHTIAVRETATNAGGDGRPADSAATAVVVPLPPANTSAPTVTGSPGQGQTLTVHHGGWTNGPTAYAHQWLRCDAQGSGCAPIDGATDETYVLSGEDVGATIRVRETASNAGGDSQPTLSAATAAISPPPPVNTAAPTIAGTAQQGETLTAQRGTWTNAPTSYAYQWERCSSLGLSCLPIPGAVASTYVPVAADVGHALVVLETASNAGGAGAAAASAATAAVVAAAPVNNARPTIAGAAMEGQTLTEHQGQWTNQPESYAYAWLRCDAAGAGCQPIAGAAGQTYVPDSADVGHRLAVSETATNAGGSASATSAPTAVVAPYVAPHTTLGPVPADPTNAATPEIAFTGQPDGVTFQCSVDGAAFAACMSPLALTGLNDGAHVVDVRAADAFGDVEDPPAEYRFTVDRTAPETTITGAPSGPVHSAPHFDFSADEAGVFECAVDDGSYTACRSGDPVPITGLAVGPHTFHVRARDRAGNADATPADAPFTLADEAPAATLAVTPDAGTAGLQTQSALGGTDPDGDPLTYELDFGDGTTQSGALPQAPVAHTYTRAGVFVQRFKVSDGTLSSVVTHTVSVALAEPLRADAGDDLVAVAGRPVTLDGSGSRPAAGIESEHWAFGDGGAADGAKVTYTYAAAGTYTATLTATAGGQTDSDTATVTVVRPEDAPGIDATVQDGGTPLSGADVMLMTADGRRVSAVTDATGHARLAGLPDGAYSVLAYADGHLPGSAPVTVSGGGGRVTVDLPAGEVAKATVTSRTLSAAEAQALGVDLADPANQHAVKFSITLQTTSLDGCVGDGGFISGCAGLDCASRTECHLHLAGEDANLEYDPESHSLTTLVLPGSAKWLKEFFEVSMTVTNLASDSQFVLRNGVARLTLPPGLSIAPSRLGDSPVTPMGDIPGGGSATARWVVRGDEEGEYTPSADYAATLEPFGASVSVHAAAQTPLKVWGASALELTVDADDTAYAHNPYHVTVGLKNVADVPVYNVSLALSAQGVNNFIFQPREQLSSSAGTLAPGDSLEHDYVLVPTITGKLDLDRSFVAFGAGAEKLASAIATHAPVDPPDTAPKLATVSLKDKVGLLWDKVPGATGYQVYSTPDPATPFSATPDPNVQILADDGGQMRAVARNVPAFSTRWYAVSPIVDGKPLMSHPLVSGLSGSTDPSILLHRTYSWGSGTEHMCDARDGTATLKFDTTFFDVAGYTISGPDGQTIVKSGLSGHASTDETIHGINPGDEIDISVTSSDDQGAPTTWKLKFDSVCEVERAVVVAMGLKSSLSDRDDTVTLKPGCGDAADPTPVDAFNQQAATNACDAAGDPKGNVIAYLRKLGYDPGAHRDSSNRTLLEFSYTDATVDCDASGGPKFTPKPYTAGQTWAELFDQVLGDQTDTASRFLRRLKEYSECWRQKHGRVLRYTVIGHSLGGYEALAMARAARHDNDADLIDSIVSVDGAVQQYMVPFELELGDCFLSGDNAFRLPADIEQTYAVHLVEPGYESALQALHKADALVVQHQISDVRDFGIKVATVTNHYDTCLHEDATINSAATDRKVFRIHRDDWKGTDSHGAALQSHRLVDGDAGFPLMSFMEKRGYLHPHGLIVGATGLEARSAKRLAGRATAAGGTLSGRVAWAGGGAPSGGAQVTALGDDAMDYVTTADDGSFAFTDLPAGRYTLQVTSLGAEPSSTWAGGSAETATAFDLGSDPLDVGTIALTPPATTSVTVVDPGGAPVPGAAVLLFDSGHRQVAAGDADANGRVDLVSPPGTYTLAAASPQSTPASQTVDATSSGSVRVTLQPGLSVTATAKDADGSPLADVAVALYGPGGALQSAGFTNGDGSFSFLGVDPGDYTLRLIEPLGRFGLPDVQLPVSAVPGDPAAGVAGFQIGRTPVLTSGAPPSGRVGDAYSFAFTASGDGVTYALASGQLPPGLALSGDGRLTGTPRTAGAYTFVVRVSNAAGAVLSGALRIAVAAAVQAQTPPVVTPPAVTPPAVTPPVGVAPAGDTTAPRISRVKVSTGAFAKGRLAASLIVGEPSTVTAQLLLPASTANKLKVKGRSTKVRRARYVIVGKSRPVALTGKGKLTVRLAKSVLKRLRKPHKLAMVLRLTAEDAAGNARAVTKRVTVKPRR